MTITYRFAIEDRTNGKGPVEDATAEEVSALPILGQFQGAMDLPDGTEFADGWDDDDRKIRVYRIAE